MMKRSHDQKEDVEGEVDNSGVLDLDRVSDIQKKEIWTQMRYYKQLVKECESQLLLSRNQLNTLRLFLLTTLFHFSPESDAKALVDELLSSPDIKQDIDETLAKELKNVSSRDVNDIDVLRGHLAHSKLKIAEYEKLISEAKEELQALKRRSIKQQQGDKKHMIHPLPQEEISAAASVEGLSGLKQVADEQRNEISVLIQKCSSLEKEKEALAHLLRIIPPNLLADPSQLDLVLNKYREMEESNKALGLLMERYKKEFDDMYTQSKSSVEDLKNRCVHDIEAQHDKMKNFREESVRLRQERDKMRTLYEENNSALSHANKKINHLQVLQSSLEAKHASVEKGASKRDLLADLIKSSTGDDEHARKLKSMLDTESQLSEELDLLTKAFDDMQVSYKELLKTFDEKCESYTKLLSEIDSEQRAAEINSRLVQAQAKLQDMKVKLEHYSKQNELLSSQKELPALLQKIEECAKLKDENSRLKERLGSHSGESGTTDELGLYRKLLYCNSCHINMKNTVLLKCMHVFCRSCIDIRLETRQRKCPNCGDPFSTTDVKSIYL